MPYRLTTRARRDLLGIWLHIAEENESAADRLIENITERFLLLASHPEAGRTRDDVRAGYRGFPVGRYVIFYRVEERGVAIVHVTHGSRGNLA
ncbi:MAG: type II toxin-antitoxin system RelE/ParE family toxin [Vicinamibacterales bacterium]